MQQRIAELWRALAPRHTHQMFPYYVGAILVVAHAVGLHGVQILGALAFVLGLGRLAVREQTTLMVMAIAGYAGLLGAVTAQTYRGLAPLDLDVTTAAVVAGSLLLLGAVFTRAVAAWLLPVEVPDRIAANT